VIVMQIATVERLHLDRYRLAVIYGEIFIYNVIAMARAGHVRAVQPSAMRALDAWVALVTWSCETCEHIHVLADTSVQRIDRGKGGDH
jgi:hypothetical protein